MFDDTPDLPDLPDPLILAYAPPGPLPGGGRDRRIRRALWGIAPLAVTPDAWPAGARRRLVRAATVSSALGIAWMGTPVGGHLPVPTAHGPMRHHVEHADDADDAVEAPPSSPVAFERAGGSPPAPEGGVRAAGRETGAAPDPAGRVAERAAAPAADRDAWRDNVIATHEDVEIVQPSPHVAMVGFHEGAGHTLDVVPGARPHRDLGSRPVESPSRRDDLRSMVLPERGRGTGAATAIDIAMPVGRQVFAPVTGTVTAVSPYTLYGKYADTIIVIQPDDAPDVQLKVLHVTGPQVAIGDHVEAGRTPLADSATAFPFESQIDRFVEPFAGRALPHVHMELMRAAEAPPTP